MDADLHVPQLEFEQRWRRFWPTAEDCLRRVYGGRPDLDSWLQRISSVVREMAAARPAELRLHDQCRGAWWREGSAVGYSAYVDRLAGGLRQLQTRIPYLRELGVTYLHLLPLLKAREGESDGGFAVSDFGVVDPRLGVTADLSDLAGKSREAGIRLAVDLVCNHTSDDHAWRARRARAMRGTANTTMCCRISRRRSSTRSGSLMSFPTQLRAISLTYLRWAGGSGPPSIHFNGT